MAKQALCRWSAEARSTKPSSLQGIALSAANTRLMGALTPIALLLDAAVSLQNFVSVFIGIYVLLIIVHILLSSWVRLPYSRTGQGVQQFLDEICSPYLRLFRGRIPTLGPFDLSPMVAIVVLLVAAGLINRLIGALL